MLRYSLSRSLQDIRLRACHVVVSSKQQEVHQNTYLTACFWAPGQVRMRSKRNSILVIPRKRVCLFWLAYNHVTSVYILSAVPEEKTAAIDPHRRRIIFIMWAVQRYGRVLQECHRNAHHSIHPSDCGWHESIRFVELCVDVDILFVSFQRGESSCCCCLLKLVVSSWRTSLLCYIAFSPKHYCVHLSTVNNNQNVTTGNRIFVDWMRERSLPNKVASRT